MFLLSIYRFCNYVIATYVIFIFKNIPCFNYDADFSFSLLVALLFIKKAQNSFMLCALYAGKPCYFNFIPR